MSREGYSVLRASRAGPCGRNEPAPKAATSVRAGGYTDTGRKLENQDTFKIQQMKSTGDLYVSVLDGHGANGKAVAHQARDLLYEKIERAKDFASDRKTSMKQACTRTHAAIVNGSIDASLSGTTATYAVINRAVGELVIGCVGDTRAIIGRKDASGKMGVAALTRDHNCDDPREAQRVRRAGGKVEPYRSGEQLIGPNRIWNPGPVQRLPGLCVSRSIGDTFAHSLGCSAEPEIQDIVLTSRDKFLILASDGVWDGITNREAVDIVEQQRDPTRAAKALVKAGLAGMDRNHLEDNATAVVVYFN
ncbi:uncharacterized protein [Oscarella lobularis]|uniref:uncharacterized protein n=1 Tax=Oscarella lobularis TaxID=121494 RepID=UPI0033132DC1